MHNHLNLGNRYTKVGLLDYNIILPDATNIVLYPYFSIHNCIVSNQCDSTYLVLKRDNDTANKVNKLLKKYIILQI